MSTARTGVVVAAPDKFRGTATAQEVADAIASAVDERATCLTMPLADGGEGTLEAWGGPNRQSVVTGPSGRPVPAPWRLDGSGTAIIEMALASGLLIAGGAEANDPWAATTRGTGELIVAAAEAGAHTIVVGLGGSATTDGGLGAVQAMTQSPAWAPSHPSPERPDLVVCCDVDTLFADAAAVFGPQKGADPDTARALTARLLRLAEHYRTTYGVDVAHAPGAGAAGGLAGGLLALGAVLRPGFAVVAGAVGLGPAVQGADLVVTGEGSLDDASFSGKVVGGVLEVGRAAGVPVVAIVGRCAPGTRIPSDLCVLDLSAAFGGDYARAHTLDAVRTLLGRHLDQATPPL